MTRKVLDYTVAEEGRDKGKTFEITEMPADQAQRWARMCFGALARAGVDIGDIPQDMEGLAGASVRLLALVPVYEQDELIAQLMRCIRFKPDPTHRNLVRDMQIDDIEEPKTHFLLQWETVKLHVGFSTAGSAPQSTSTTPPASESSSSPAPTSPRRSPPRSVPGSRR